MPSADLFLRLLKEKDLVSAEVLQAARREIETTSPPLDAVRISLWLVQGHHITAGQAERLLSAAAEKTELPSPKLPIPSAFLPKSSDAVRPPEEAAKPGGSYRARSSDSRRLADQAGKPDVRPPGPKAPQPQHPEQPLKTTWNLPRWGRQAKTDGHPRIRPSPVPPAGQSNGANLLQASSPAGVQGKQKPLPAPKTEGQGEKGPASARLGGDLESLGGEMSGPLDALIESEALSAIGV